MIYLVVALPAEAKPLVAHHGLQRDPRCHAFALYRRETMQLIVSGVGKAACSAATAYLAGLNGDSANSAWLNVGVAGHAERALGEAILAHRICDAASRRQWYPPLVFEAPCGGGQVLTVDRAEQNYRTTPGDGPWVYDMEASAFYPTACRWSSAELVQSYKVISDNLSTPSGKVSASSVQRLITDRLADIDYLLERLATLATRLNENECQPQQEQPFLQRWRFTVYQQRRLRRLLARWRARAPDREIWCDELRTCRAASEVLQRLARRIDQQPVSLS